MEVQFNRLYECLNNNERLEAESIITNVTTTFSDGLNTTEIEAYMLQIFNKNTGLVNYISKALFKKDLATSILKGIELLEFLINNCFGQLEKYVMYITKLVVMVSNSPAASSKIKEKSLNLLQIIVDRPKAVYNEENIQEIGKKILSQFLLKETNSVLGKLISVVGKILKWYPTAIAEPEKIFNNVLSTFYNDLNKKCNSPSHLGYLHFIMDYLETNSKSLNDLTRQRIYDCIKSTAGTHHSHTRTVGRDSLYLFANHIKEFTTFLLADSNWWNNQLRSWLEKTIHEDRRAGYTALISFNQELANILATSTDEQHRQIFNQFFEIFHEALNETTLTDYKLRLAIRGLGLFAHCYRIYKSPNDLHNVFISIVDRMDVIYLRDIKSCRIYLEYLPDYLQTIANFIKEFETLNHNQLSCLEKLTVLLIRMFPMLSTTHHYFVIEAVVKTMYHLKCVKNNEGILDRFLQNVVYQGVMWTCSNMILSDADAIQNDSGDVITTYKTYLPIWTGLLGMSQAKNCCKFSLTPQDGIYLSTSVFDELIKVLFVLINKLNLNTREKSDDHSLEADRVSDFVIFANLVDFYCELLAVIEPKYYHKWTDKFTSQIVNKSVQHPIVSGFYKLQARNLQLCEALDYFATKRLDKEHVKYVFEASKSHIELIIARMVQYTGDLQIACLQNILTTPIAIVETMSTNFAPTFIAVFTVGRSYLQIADLGLDTLEKWTKYLPNSKMRPLLEQVIPCLDSYLRSKQRVGYVQKHELLHSFSKKSKKILHTESESELLNVQRKILMLLARLDGEMCYEFVNANVKTETVLYENTHLRLGLVFEGLANGGIYLESFVPRVLELALYSSDAKTRMAASELLHSIVMVLLGISAKMDITRVSDLDKILERIISTVIQLSCDYENAIRELYHLLLMQLMHWYSHPRQLKSAQTAIVLNALFDSTIHSVNSNVRNISGQAIHEFVKYTRKQTKSADLERDPANIEAIIRTINSYNLHPDPVKRLAGAIIFNHTYTELREEQFILNIYWMELFYSFVISISLQDIWTSADDSRLVQITRALDHLMRGFVEKSALFKKSDNKRRIPTTFRGTTLVDLAKFLFNHSTGINVNCRQKCLEMFLKIAPLSKTSLKVFFESEIIDHNWSEKFEHELIQKPTMQDVKTSEESFRWLLNLLCALDGALFILKNTLEYNYSASSTSKAVKYYLNHVLTLNLKQLFNNLKIAYNITEKNRFDDLKSLLAKRLLDFTIIASSFEQTNTYEIAMFFNEDFILFFCNCLFNHENIGFRGADLTELNKELVIIINRLNDCLSKDCILKICTGISDYILSNFTEICEIKDQSVSRKQRILLNGIRTLQTSKFNEYIQINYPEILDIVIENSVETSEDMCQTRSLSSTAVDYLNLLLQLVINNEEQVNKIIQHVVDGKTIKIVGENNYQRYGYYIYKTFTPTFIKLVTTNDFVLNEIIRQLNPADSFEIVTDILKHIEKSKSDGLTKVVTIIFHSWNIFLPYFNTNRRNVLLGLEIIGYFNTHNNNIYKWIEKLFTTERVGKIDEASFEYLNNIVKVLHHVMVSEENEISYRNCLNIMKTNYFQDLRKDSVKTAAKNTILQLIQSSIDSKSKILMEFSVDLYLQYFDTADEFNRINLPKLVVIINLDKEILSLLYQVSLKPNYNVNQRILATNIVCDVLRQIKFPNFNNFVADYVESIYETMIVDCVDNFTDKITSVIIIEMIFGRINYEQFTTEYFDSKTGQEITKGILKVLMNVWKDDHADIIDLETKNARQKYFCYAYNSLVSIICNTQTQIEFYYRLFRRDDKNGKDVLWSKLIDLSKVVSFEEKFEVAPERRTILLQIKSTIKKERSSKDCTEVKTIKYIESQPLFDSSLNEDITKYDFSNVTIRSQDLVDEMEVDEEVLETDNVKIVLENLEINSHDCMATICGLIQHMVDKNITVPTSKNRNILPKWVTDIADLLEDETLHRNIKIFLIKIIHNMQHIFKEYAVTFFAAISNCIISETLGDKLNFFNTDIVIMLIHWFTDQNDVCNRKVLSKLFKFLVEKLNCDVRDVFKYYLEIIKDFVELWKGKFDVPYETILEKLKLPVTSKRLEIGVQVTAILLCNDMKPWASNGIASIAVALTNILENNSIQVYKACSETIGMAIRALQDQPDMQEKFIAKLEKSLKVQNKNKLAYCLEAIMKYHTPICRNHLVDLIYDIHIVPANFKYIYLRIFLKGLDILLGLRDFENIDLKELLSNSDTSVQLVALEIILKSVTVLSVTKLVVLVDYIFSKFPNSGDVACRSTMYDICIAVYERFKHSEDEEVQKLLAQTRDCLLQGFVENEPEIEIKLRKFWCRNHILPSDLQQRFLFILEHLYSSNVEEQFLAYSVYFLLESVQNKSFNDSLFEYPLHDCEYSEFILRSDWRSKHATIAPMFASSLSTQNTMDVTVPISASDFNKLRATQSQFAFSATQQDLTVMNTIENEKAKVLQPSKSSLIFQYSQDFNNDRDVGSDEDEDNKSNVFKNPNDLLISKEYKLKSRRLLVDKDEVSKSFALSNVAKRDRRGVLRKELAAQREKKVELYRGYRTGEFPDIQISQSAVITPLLVLAKYDSQIARTLFTNICDEIMSEAIPTDFLANLSRTIDTVLNASREYLPNVIGTFLDIALTHKSTIQFNPHTITKVSIESGLMSVGSLLLEEYLILGIDKPAQIGNATETEITFWTKLAILYKEIEEWDVVRAIFFEKMDCKENVLKVLDCEAQGLWTSAIKLYPSIITEEFFAERKDFYYESNFKCFAELTKWSDLSDSIVNSVDDSSNPRAATWNKLWDKDFNQDKLLPWYFKAELRNIIGNNDRKSEFLSCVNEALLDLDRQEVLKWNFAEDMAFLWVLNQDLDLAKYYLNNYITKFLNDWHGLNPLFVSLRSNNLVRMRNALEMYLFIKKYMEITPGNFDRISNELLQFWEQSSVENVPSIVLNETRNIYRTSLLPILSVKATQSLQSPDKLEEFSLRLKKTRFVLNMNMINSALKQNNFHVAKDFLKYNKEYLVAKEVSEEQLNSLLAFSKTVLLKSRIIVEPKEKLKFLREAMLKLDIFNKNLNSNLLKNLSIQLPYSQHVFNITEDIYQITNSNLELYSYDIAKLFKTTSPYEVKLHGITQLEKALFTSEQQLQGNTKEVSNIANCYVKLAFSVMNLESEVQGFQDKHEQDLTRYILKAMYFGSTEGCQLFPCLLNLKSLGDKFELNNLFLEESKKIEAWMFIQWIPQLLANADSAKLLVTSDIILNIAKLYPQALIFPYRLSKPTLKFTDSKIEKFAKDVFEQLDELLLKDNKIEKLLESLSAISVPENILLDCVGKLIKAKSPDAFMEAYNEIYNDLFVVEYSLRDSQSSVGRVFKQVLDFKSKFTNLLAVKNNTITLKKKLKEILEAVKNIKTTAAKLKDYSPWLHNFHSFRDDFEIEIPGQYSGYSKPLPEYHVKISGFSPEVKHFESLRGPIQIKILGNDSKEYPFLVKYGEDLRQDQRIQQLFLLMNNLLKTDANCSQRKLSILTYQVIPLTTSLGLIQWVRETTTFHRFIDDSLPKDTLKKANSLQMKYEKWLRKFSKSTSTKQIYIDMCFTCDKNDVVPFYRSLVNEVPWDVLRTGFWKLSTNAESFFALRRNFVTSYAVLCVCQWLLGIGDRHLQNTLISNATCEAIGIDFGHAFGTATELLQVPEMVPIRLTPHLLNLTQPLNEHGLLQEAMIHTLRALRGGDEGGGRGLLATMRVFIQEPTVDWSSQTMAACGGQLHHVEGIEAGTGTGSSSGDGVQEMLEWYPAKKIALARRKLNGANPCSITIEELKSRKGDPSQLTEKYIEIVRGEKQDNIRARLGDDELSAEEQIRCLIDQATDYNILGRMYSGWRSWV